jgi:hypothetical protein
MIPQTLQEEAFLKIEPMVSRDPEVYPCSGWIQAVSHSNIREAFASPIFRDGCSITRRR